MTLSEELEWRGFVNQTTYQNITELDGDPISFYWGVDPSADSMQIGNLAAGMMVRHFIDHGHSAILLVGGATGIIGDPDGKVSERDLKSLDVIEHNKKAIAEQYKQIFAGRQFELVDNYDWFKDIKYLDFLRDIGKHVPMRQMLNREFVTSRLGEDGAGISYAEFSYSLMQAYDYLYLHKNKNVSLQVCGADQWGNCIAGVDLIRRITGDTVNVWSTPLIVNKSTGVKFGKSEDGAVWLDPKKTTPTAFYQFWINCDDLGVPDYLKVYTLLGKEEIDNLLKEHSKNPSLRLAQKRLAHEVTTLVHGEQATSTAEAVTGYLTGDLAVADASPEVLESLRQEIPFTKAQPGEPLAEVLKKTGLCSSNNEARQLISSRAISINGQVTERASLETGDFTGGRLLLRRGKAFKDSALIEL